MPLAGLGRRLFNLITDALDYVFDQVTGAGSKVASVIASGISDAWDAFPLHPDKLLTWFLNHAGNFIWDESSFLNRGYAFFTRRAFFSLSGGKRSTFDVLIEALTGGDFDPQIKSAIRKFLKQSNDFGEIIAALGIPGAAFSTILAAETATYVENARQQDLRADPLMPLDVGTIMQMWQRGGLGKGELTDHLLRQGINPNVAAGIEAATRQFLPLAQLAIAAQHGDSSPSAIAEAARLQGYDSNSVAAAVSLAKNYMPLAQLAIAAQHGDISPSAISDSARAQGMTPGDVQAAISLARNFLNPVQLAQAAQRKGIADSEVSDSAHKQGYSTTDVNAAKALARNLLTPLALVTAMFRGEIGSGEYVDKMREAGFSTQDAETFKQISFFLPPPTDLISWLGHEVFEPDSVLKYGLSDELEKVQTDLFEKIGVSQEQARNYWIAHWQHPSFTQVGEMFIRDILTSPEDRDRVKPGSPEWEAVRTRAEEEVFEWFRLVEVPPFWRRRMTNMLYQPYTRVDIRRMWDLDVVDDDAVIRAYLDQGYDIDHANNLLAFTKVERRLPDIVARYRNGWISQGDVLTELQSLGISSETATRLYQRKFANLEQPTRIATERDLTKTEIIKGVKQNQLSSDLAIEYLMRLGYDQAEAEFLVLINTEFVTSPDSPLEFRRGAEAYRKATGRDFVAIPQSVIDLEKRLIAAKTALSAATTQGSTQAQIDVLRTNVARLQAEFEIETKRLNL